MNGVWVTSAKLYVVHDNVSKTMSFCVLYLPCAKPLFMFWGCYTTLGCLLDAATVKIGGVLEEHVFRGRTAGCALCKNQSVLFQCGP